MKKAIYFDDRERDLARRVFHVACCEFEKVANAGRFGQTAALWTRDEVMALCIKFGDEPVQDPQP